MRTTGPRYGDEQLRCPGCGEGSEGPGRAPRGRTEAAGRRACCGTGSAPSKLCLCGKLRVGRESRHGDDVCHTFWLFSTG